MGPRDRVWLYDSRDLWCEPSLDKGGKGPEPGASVAGRYGEPYKLGLEEWTQINVLSKLKRVI